VHDITDLESRGIPGGFIASTEFIDAAKAQSEALGFTPNSVFVQHPIQDRTQEEVEQLAEEAFDDILALVQHKN
jgi:hypothetical protein